MPEYFLLLVAVIVRLCWTLELPSEHFNYSTFRDVTLALYEDVKFMAERIEEVNADAVFGLTLAQVNLVAVLSSKNNEFILENEWTRLVKTHQLCNNSRVHALNKLLRKKNGPLNALIEVLTRPDIWMKTILWRKGVLRPIYLASADLTIAKAKALIFSGTPNEYGSNYCLMELVDDNCEVSDNCVDILMKNDGSRGYPLTHRLLYIKIAATINCKENPRANFSLLVDEYCQEILQDLIDLEYTNFPSVSRDLAMEQIVLCGMEGYLEFTTEHYADLIASWRNSHGCYSAVNINQRERNIRRKRSTNPMDYGCDSHASGVAAATLSLFTRVYIENNLSLINKMNSFY